MKSLLVSLALGAAALVGTAASQAEARFFDPALTPPTLVESVACRVVRERVRRPNGNVIVRTTRRCGPGMGMGMGRRMDGCRVVRERVQRPNGNVVFRTVRRCG